MEQMSFFDGEKIAFPLSHEDVLKLHKLYIDEDEKDKDAFTWKEIKDGYSYFFYGTKVMDYTVTPSGKARFRIRQDLRKEDEEGSGKERFVIISSDCDLQPYMERLKKAKQVLFRNLITETFACCNDFERCSDARKCLKTEDRMYNGCLYRKNLEAGRIFYGKNKNA